MLRVAAFRENGDTYKVGIRDWHQVADATREVAHAKAHHGSQIRRYGLEIVEAE